ncbi:MAG TPA: penicillin-binding transpeptidase domain-containing protein [Pyrinomonadaceae bacterium]|nr:penicillin-binding transpeptidase domain-containing protein [Pyrinomonadaceae bacterium]
MAKHTMRAFISLTLLLSIGVAEATAQNLSRIFDKTEGAFVLYDLKNKRYVRHNEERCRRRFTPASTFKIPNSLIGLETNVVRDAEHMVAWDRQRYSDEGRPNIAPFNEWWRDHTLRSAMRYSVVWYYMELARKVGAPGMQKYVKQFRYGNGDTSGGIEQFWRNSSLQISADEQVDFLRRFYAGQLSVSRRSTEIVKDILLLEETAAYKLSGKTGAAPLENGGTLAWFVGYLEREGNVYFFALNMDGANYEAIRDERINLTKRILTELGYLPKTSTGRD